MEQDILTSTNRFSSSHLKVHNYRRLFDKDTDDTIIKKNSSQYSLYQQYSYAETWTLRDITEIFSKNIIKHFIIVLSIQKFV